MMLEELITKFTDASTYQYLAAAVARQLAKEEGATVQARAIAP
jgi:hypothetical protein